LDEFPLQMLRSSIRYLSTKEDIYHQYTNLKDVYHEYIQNSQLDSSDRLKYDLKFLELSKLFHEIYYELPNDTT